MWLIEQKLACVCVDQVIGDLLVGMESWIGRRCSPYAFRAHVGGLPGAGPSHAGARCNLKLFHRPRPAWDEWRLVT